MIMHLAALLAYLRCPELYRPTSYHHLTYHACVYPHWMAEAIRQAEGGDPEPLRRLLGDAAEDGYLELTPSLRALADAVWPSGGLRPRDGEERGGGCAPTPGGIEHITASDSEAS